MSLMSMSRSLPTRIVLANSVSVVGCPLILGQWSERYEQAVSACAARAECSPGFDVYFEVGQLMAFLQRLTGCSTS